MRISIVGTNLPGSRFWRSDGSPMSNVHVGVQQRREPAELIRADAAEVRWEIEVEVVDLDDGQLDVRGPAVQGKRGERFIYLTWGEVGAGGEFEMFRRAKLMLNRIEADVINAARTVDRIVVTVDLTGEDGGPRCARVDPPAIRWSVPSS